MGQLRSVPACGAANPAFLHPDRIMGCHSAQEGNCCLYEHASIASVYKPCRHRGIRQTAQFVYAYCNNLCIQYIQLLSSCRNTRSQSLRPHTSRSPNPTGCKSPCLPLDAPLLPSFPPSALSLGLNRRDYECGVYHRLCTLPAETTLTLYLCMHMLTRCWNFKKSPR